MGKQIEVNLKITNNPDIPAFAAYVKDSINTGQAKILLNIEASLQVSAQHDLTFNDLITESVLHELFHAFQEMFDRTFDEEEVETQIQKIRNDTYE